MNVAIVPAAARPLRPAIPPAADATSIRPASSAIRSRAAANGSEPTMRRHLQNVSAADLNRPASSSSAMH